MDEGVESLLVDSGHDHRGVTLTPLEGVEVLFLANSDDQSSGQWIVMLSCW